MLSETNLPDVTTARLPQTYEAAKSALAECSRIDECMEWADKAQALASYAKQSKDESLRKMATRIQARAIRRCGELLKQIDAQGVRNDQLRKGGHPKLTRESASEEAGISKHQRRAALRVASVPAADFDRQIDSETPPTVTALADQGKRTLINLGDTSPDDFKIATTTLGQLRRFSEFAGSTDAIRAARGLNASEAAEARAMVQTIDAWNDRFIVSITE